VKLVERFPLIGSVVNHQRGFRKIFIKPYFLLYYRLSADKIAMFTSFMADKIPIN